MKEHWKNSTRISPLVLSAFVMLGVLGQARTLCQDDLSDKPKDFSNTNSVTVSLGEGPGRVSIGENGLRYFAAARGDAHSTFMSVEGMPCRCLDPSVARYPKAYFSFSIDPTFKDEEINHVKIEVEYFDGFAGFHGVMGLQYDATGKAKGPRPNDTPCYPNVPLRGSQKWLKATFHVKEATFQNAQTASGDFRLWASPPELCVKRVTVSLEPEGEAPKEVPLSFNAEGEGTLGEWNVQWDAGTRPTFASNLKGEAGPRWLEVRPSDSFGAGSWRTTALLEPGAYQFVGKARTQGLEGEEGAGGEKGGVRLRISFHWSGQFVPTATNWTSLTYDFTMAERGYVELICDVQGSRGSARFDPDSLKLIRKKTQAAP